MNPIRSSILRSFAKAPPYLLTLLSVAACGGMKATPTIVPATPTVAVTTATAVTPLLLTPRAPFGGGSVLPSGTVGATPAGMIYTDPRGRFSFFVPDGYYQTPDSPQQPDVVARFESRMISGGILVNIQGMEPGATLDLKTQVTQAAASKLPEYQALTTQPATTTVAGQPARRFEFLLTENGGRRYHALLITTVRGNDFYTLTIQIEEKDFTAYLAQAKIFSNTFAFLVA